MTVTTASTPIAFNPGKAFDGGDLLEIPAIHPNPLDDDQPGDAPVVTTRRAITRVALVATEVAGRFQREHVPHDPMTWMLAPRALFHGASAVDACLARDACLRGVLVHGLSLGLDADPDQLDSLLADDENADGPDFFGKELRGPLPAIPEQQSGRGGLRLFTAVIAASDGSEHLQAFHASLATEKAEVAGRLYMRMGIAMANAVIVDGFDASMPLVTALVSPALCDTLSIVADDPGSPMAAGLDLNIEQRFLN